MKKSEFKIWLIQNGYTQKSLAKRLEITEQTITKYNGLTRYPEIFLLALKALEIKA
jgi:DNA-binding XRE family transcriptional regulator